jgi:integrase
VFAEEWLDGSSASSTIDSYRATMSYAKAVFNADEAPSRARRLPQLGGGARARHSEPVREIPRGARPRLGKKEAAYFTNDELPVLFAKVEPGLIRTLFLVALKTGMRIGDLSALTWADVDLSEGVIHVRHRFTNGRLETPKNRERGRQIPWLSRHLGHSSLAVTIEVYGHGERAERNREARAIEGVFGV